ncbi:hypothetical protein T484DRAFT_1951735 [Baffinella frigidus]|nr:hypothetical protein T484DRAFT_1951735 [Cryptophyta sp. CCMP2293]
MPYCTTAKSGCPILPCRSSRTSSTRTFSWCGGGATLEARPKISPSREMTKSVSRKPSVGPTTLTRPASWL